VPLDDMDARAMEDAWGHRRPTSVTVAAAIVLVGGAACFPLGIVIVATEGGGGPGLGLWFAATAFVYLWLATRLRTGSSAARTAIVVLFAANIALEFLGSMGIALFVSLAVNGVVIALLTSRAAEHFYRRDARERSSLAR
jgi:hypothetical protein